MIEKRREGGEWPVSNKEKVANCIDVNFGAMFQFYISIMAVKFTNINKEKGANCIDVNFGAMFQF